MSIKTAWVKPVAAITGQDHLGTIAPGESIYVEQLPGITNVTARARYYSFYPWLLRELERRKPEADAQGFVQYLRRAECVFALVAIRHARVLDEDESFHGATMVGREKLVPAIDKIDESDGVVQLAAHASLEESKLRYFMNPLGGLGQYYFGALRELGILGGDTRTRDLRYTAERGEPLAEAFGANVGAAPFFKLLDKATVTLDDLDSLSSVCPCGLAKREKQLLVDVLADPKGQLGDEARTRRGTLALVLDLVSKRAASEYDFAGEFRASAYSGALLDGSAWHLPAGLASSVAAWSAYERHELLSVAFQGLFSAALAACEAGGRRRFRDPNDLATFAVDRLRSAIPASSATLTLGQFIATRPLQRLPDWADDAHEVQAGWRIVDRTSTAETVVADSLSILATLVARSASEDAYARLHFHPGYFDRYPINLDSFTRRVKREWSGKPLDAVIASWIVWALRTHWRIALQKLAEATPRDTFKVRPLDGELLIVEAPAPTFSVPRIHRVVGLLQDLGLIVPDDDDRPMLTPDGERLRGALLG